jgi:hypothetical protein
VFDARLKLTNEAKLRPVCPVRKYFRHVVYLYAEKMDFLRTTFQPKESSATVIPLAPV